MGYRCRGCWKHFSVKTGTCMASSKVPLRKWAYAIYLDVTSLKGVSSMKLHRDIGVSQKTAWFMQQRIREAFGNLVPDSEKMAGPVEVDETYVGGLERNKHESEKLGAGRGPVGKTAVVGARLQGVIRRPSRGREALARTRPVPLGLRHRCVVAVGLSRTWGPHRYVQRKRQASCPGT